MKDKRLQLKISIIVISILVISIIILAILGIKERKGYLSEFKLNIDKTLEINGLDVDRTRQLFTIDNKLDENSISNFIFTNASIINYNYDFRIKYYSKIFRNINIYNVDIDIDKIINDNIFIKQIKIEDTGSTFGNIVSSKIIKEEKIDNIIYTLTIKENIILYFLLIIILSIIILSFIFRKNIKELLLNAELKNKRKKILLIYLSISIIIFFMFVLINISISKKQYTNKLYDYDLIEYSDAGYVYKIKLSEFYKDNIFYNINEKTINIANTNSILSYGYNVVITNIPFVDNVNDAYYTEDNSFIISNNYYNIDAYYNIQIPLEIGYKYKIDILSKQIPTNENIKYDLTVYQKEINITNVNFYSNYVLLTDIKEVISKNFRDFYLIFPKGVTEVKYISINNINDDIKIVDGNYIILTLKDKDVSNIESINYSINIKRSFFIFILIIFILPIAIYFYLKYLLFISSRDKIAFAVLTATISCIFAIFQFWLFFPGYFYDWDWLYINKISLSNSPLQNWQPFIYQLIMTSLFKIFGFHSYYFFIINLICFHLSFFLIIIALYYKFNNKKVILIYLIPFVVGDFFFYPIFSAKDYILSNNMFLLCSLMFFKFVIDINKKCINMILYLSIFILMILVLLLKHNAIVMVYPLTVMLAYKIVNKNNNIKIYLLKFSSLMIIFAIILIMAFKFIPLIFLGNEKSQISSLGINNPLAFNIGGIAYLSDNDSFIKDEWYLEGKNFNDLKKSYSNSYYHSRPNFFELSAFDNITRNIDSSELVESFFNYIKNEPISYVKFVGMIINCLWFDRQFYSAFVEPGPLESISYGFPNDNYSVSSKYPIKEQKITFSKIKRNIYDFLLNKILILRDIYNIIPISIGIIIFIVSSLIWLLKKNMRSYILLLSFLYSFSIISFSLIVVLFSPSGRFVETRYLAPVFPIATICVIAFISFICDTKKYLNKK